jgi:heat shock protein HslJ
VLMLVLVGLAAACGGSGGAGDPEAGGDPTGSWVLRAGTHAGGEVPIVDGYDITLDVDDDRWGGTAACNSYGASVTIRGDRLEIDGLHATEMACMDAGVMDSEAAYLAAFGGVERFTEDDTGLTLHGDDILLEYEPRPDAPADTGPSDDTDPDTPVSDEP